MSKYYMKLKKGKDYRFDNYTFRRDTEVAVNKAQYDYLSNLDNFESRKVSQKKLVDTPPIDPPVDPPKVDEEKETKPKGKGKGKKEEEVADDVEKEEETEDKEEEK